MNEKTGRNILCLSLWKAFSMEGNISGNPLTGPEYINTFLPIYFGRQYKKKLCSTLITAHTAI